MAPWLFDDDEPLHVEEPPPGIVIKAVLQLGQKTNDGRLVEGVAIPWFTILKMIRKDPNSIYQISPRRWEEIIAGAYTEAGYDEVILTPRSGDKGRDVVATKFGVGSIRIFDQVKAYAPDRVVSADEVRAMVGVLTGAQNVSKGVVTTTSSFAPRITKDEFIAPLMPYRLELKPRNILLPWLEALAKKS